jgi:hypothetical protein
VSVGEADTAEPPNTLTEALTAYDAGMCPIPSAIDGTKKPFGYWKKYQTQRPTRDQIIGWFGGGHPGLGIICGEVSGGLEMFEFEGTAVRDNMFDRYSRMCDDNDLGDLLNQIAAGWSETTPGGGIHLYYRWHPTTGPRPGNVKLATRPDPNKPDETQTLIETRHEGGFTIIARSGGTTHKTGQPWERNSGGPATIVTITPEQRDQLHALTRPFHQPRHQPQNPPHEPRAGNRTDGPSWMDRTAEQLNQRPWAETLGRYGWTWSHRSGTEDYWCRPGKDPHEGHSATTNSKGTDRLIVFSSSTPFEPYDGVGLAPSYDRLDVIAYYQHNGDRVAAARAINPPDLDNDDWLGDFARHTKNPPEPETNEPKPNHIRANFHMGPAIWDLPAVEWLIDETIQTDGLTVIYGAPKSFKTFVALDMAMHLANGMNWRGLETKPTTVLYVVAEGAPGVGPRARAWCNRHHANIDRIGWVTVAPNLFATDGDTWHVGQLAADIGAGLVIIDTLARAMPGGDENSAKDIGYVIANFDSIRQQAGCALIAVHHTGKDTARGMRGSSSLQGAVDTSLEVVGDATAVNVRVADQKNAESERAWWFKPTRETPSLILEPTTGSASGEDTKDANILHQLVLLDSGGGVGATIWAEAVEERGVCGRTSFQERVRALKDAGMILNNGTDKRPRWRLTPVGRAFHDNATTQ